MQSKLPRVLAVDDDVDLLRVVAHALDEAHGNKTKAAALVGLPSYQTFTNWTKRYGVGA